MDLKDDSRKINKGDTFIAINQNEEYIKEAIEKGASKIINEKNIYEIETEIVKDARQYLADYLANKYKDELENITLIGVTGTNGKTTTAYLIYQLFSLFQIKCAYIGTIGFYLNDKIVPLNNTTPDLLNLYELFLECFKNEVKVIVMEVSSHALALKRVLGLKFDAAIFTNLTQDHLDFHENLENYKKAKQELFTNLKGQKYAIINKDTHYFEDFCFNWNNNLSYGFNGDYQLISYELTKNKTTFKLKYQDETYDFTLNIPSLYNIYNFIPALIVLNKYGFSLAEIQEKVPNLVAPPGRLELIYQDKFYIFLDYAHTPDAVLNVLKNVRAWNPNRIITLIGCGGNRDQTKRPIMGEIATNNSDYVIFTTDNPRHEKPENILKDITYNLDKNNYEVILKREEAILKGISLLKENDIFLILGKGHEQYQIINDEKIPFNEKEIVLNYLSKK